MLPVETVDKLRLEGSTALVLTYNGHKVAIVRTPEFYPHNKEERCSRQFGMCHQGHPYVKVRTITHYNIYMIITIDQYLYVIILLRNIFCVNMYNMYKCVIIKFIPNITNDHTMLYIHILE